MIIKPLNVGTGNVSFNREQIVCVRCHTVKKTDKQGTVGAAGVEAALQWRRLVADRQQSPANLSRTKYDEQTYEEIEMRQNRWVESQIGREVDTLMP